MKFTIRMKRDNRFCSWNGYIGKNYVTACNDDVDKLFDGLKKEVRATFEFSNRKPRHEDYHTFVWHDECLYKATEITRGYIPCITTFVSGCIKARFRSEMCERIYVTVY